MRAELVDHNGLICVATTDTLISVPEEVTCFYSTSYSRFEYSWLLGDRDKVVLPLPLRGIELGVYQDTTGRRWAIDPHAMPVGGTRQPVPCPKVRKGIQTRWNGTGGYWQKYLKSEGWVPA